MRSPKWAVKDSNLRRHTPADLQSAPFGHLGNRPDTFPSPGFRHTEQEPTTGVEPVTYRLQGGCSAVELRRPYDKNAPPWRLVIIPKPRSPSLSATAESVNRYHSCCSDSALAQVDPIGATPRRRLRKSAPAAKPHRELAIRQRLH